MSNILVIDDEQGIRTVLKDVFEDEGHQAFLAEDGFQGFRILETDSIDLVILDIWLPNMGGIDVLKRIKEEYPDIEVIIISGHANIKVAVDAVKLGAFDFLEKPLSLDKTITVAENALKMETLKKENRSLKQTLFMEDRIVGSSKEMTDLYNLIEQSSQSDARILIMGDNGTGKELVAREIHRRGKRAAGPFIELNCAAIPDTLIESELFGHEKGAFTDALGRRKGKFELAHKGTLFLDEIGDMSLATQAKVLRVIQELKFERVGGEESIEVDVRIIAATNKDIEKEIKERRFREDLYFRLNVIPIYVPSLRERIEDLDELVQYFMVRFKRTADNDPRTFSRSAMDILRGYSWPGNIRELKNFIERVNIMSEEKVISPQTVRLNLRILKSSESDEFYKPFTNMKLNEARDKFEREMLILKLADNDNNISRASESLGITPSSLHNKIRKFGIKINRLI